MVDERPPDGERRAVSAPAWAARRSRHADRASTINIANLLTGVRLLLVPLFVVVYFGFTEIVAWQFVSGFIFVVAITTDFLDGYFARKYGLVTPFGKIADPIADKALTGIALIGLAWNDQIWWWVTGLILVREIGITILRFAILNYGVMPADRGGKLKTLVQSVAIIMYLWPLEYFFPDSPLVVPIRVTLMAAALVITLVTGVNYVFSAARLRRQALSDRSASQSALSGPDQGGAERHGS